MKKGLPFLANVNLALCSDIDFQRTNEVFRSQLYSFIRHDNEDRSLYVPIFCRLCGTIYGAGRNGDRVMTAMIKKFEKIDIETQVPFGDMPRDEMPVAKCRLLRATTRSGEKYYFWPDEENGFYKLFDVQLQPLHYFD